MLQLTPHMRLLVCVEPIDFRNGIDGLARVCRATLAEDPFRGTVFVFRNRRSTAVKVLAYDGQGFGWWPDGASARTLAAHELQVLLSAGDPRGVNSPADWRPIGAVK
jgi:transposase